MWEAAQKVLSKKQSPMTAEEIWDAIETENLFDTTGATPVATLGVTLKRKSVNLEYSHSTSDRPFRVYSGWRFGLAEWPQDDDEPFQNSRLEKSLLAFSAIADEWFAKNKFALDYLAFFEEFFSSENLMKAEWTDFQKIGDHVHSLGSNALARKRAFGQPNYPIEQYRESFNYLANGDAPLEQRFREFISDKKNHTSKYLGSSTVSEIVGQLNANTHIFHNGRNQFTAEYLDLKPNYDRGDDAAAKFIKFNKAMRPLFEAYREIVGQRTELPLGIEIDQYCSYLYETHHGQKTEQEPEDENVQYWLLGTGRDGEDWDDFQKQSHIAIGWDQTGDLQDYEDRASLEETMEGEDNSGRGSQIDAKACWDFAKVMKPGDIIFAKRGRSTVLGKGIVTGEYRYEPGQKRPHLRDIEWTHLGEWNYPPGMRMAIKTLTNITHRKRKDVINSLFKEVNENAAPTQIEDADRNYWWMNGNPKYWDMSEEPVGFVQYYTTHGKSGYKRNKYRHFLAMQSGDLVIGYETTPTLRVTTLLEVTKPIHEVDGEERIEIKVIKQFSEGPSWKKLTNHPPLENAEPIKSNQGSLFKLTESEFKEIIRLCDEDDVANLTPYTLDDALQDLFVQREHFEKMLKRLETKKNIILQGPPGVGKTFMAKRLAYTVMEFKDDSRVSMVQFHQSYSYEDFVMGYRPHSDGSFRLKEGKFYDFCREAESDPQNRPHVFIIDEINRGNLSKIFGELLMLIEADKRSKEYQTHLAYHEHEDPEFFVPDNVYIIGMMNTADRSLAMVDYALRRRFSFIDVRAGFDTDGFKEHLAEVPKDLRNHLISVFDDLNQTIREDTTNLGPGFCVGHSYFCGTDEEALDEEKYEDIIETEIAPLLREYWFDQPKKAEEEIGKLYFKSSE